MAERDKEIEKDMQRALRDQARSLGNFYRGIMTSLRYINTTMEKYAQERGGLTMEEAAAELELIKEIERSYVKLQMLRSRHDNWLQARKKVAQLQKGVSGAAAARPAPRPAQPPAPRPAQPAAAGPVPRPAQPAAPRPPQPAAAAPAPKPAQPAAPEPASPTPVVKPKVVKPVPIIDGPPPPPVKKVPEKEEGKKKGKPKTMPPFIVSSPPPSPPKKEE